MSYLARTDALAKRLDPSRVVANARSGVVVAKGYYAGKESQTAGDPSRGVFARYARGRDYHDVLTPRLIELQGWINRELRPVSGRAYVDTGPVLERELAFRAGLGWLAKNTMLIRPHGGSYFFLGVLLLDVELDYDQPFSGQLCGSCTRCLEGCPTGALLGRDQTGAPVMDARLCISYLTIELKGAIPRQLRPLIGNRVYGCDICQEVCPHNRPKFVRLTDEPAFRPRGGLEGPALLDLIRITPQGFRDRFRGSPVRRAKRRGLLRNVAVALGNWGSPEAVPALIDALSDEEPLVRGHVAWALGQIGTPAGRSALEGRLASEENGWVLEEVELALKSAGRNLSPPGGI